jgi:carbon storage regulator CsrA
MMASMTKRRVGESVIIDRDSGNLSNEPIIIEVAGIHGYQVHLGIIVPDGFKIYRKEVYEVLKESKSQINK